MTVIKLSSLQNLTGRKYINGMALLNCFLKELDTQYGIVSNFEIRLHKPLFKIPEVSFSDSMNRNEMSIGSGQFHDSNTSKTVYYEIHPTDEDCQSFIDIDETSIEDRSVELEDRVQLSEMTEADNPQYCWNAISRRMNLMLVSGLALRAVGKQMWFTGATFLSTSFFQTPPQSIALLKSYDRISENCFVRSLVLNDRIIGTRTSVYA